MAYRPLDEHTPLAQLHSIAGRISADLKKMGLVTIGDLLWYFPFRYDDLSLVRPISQIVPEEINTVKVKIKTIKSYRSWRQKMIITEMLATDDADDIRAMWFRQKFIAQALKPGDEIYLSGKVQAGKKLIRQFVNPTYEKEKDYQIHSARLVPIYHLGGKTTQKQVRFLMDQALQKANHQADPLPTDLLQAENFPWQHEALREIHFPTKQQTLKLAVQRLKFQELLYWQLKYQLARQDYQRQNTFTIPADQALIDQTKANLPFTLTADQQQALADILADLAKNEPMNRLLEGDVGSGKTVVALLAARNVISQSKQVALMAPTEILAEQHWKNMLKILPKTTWPQLALYTRGQQENHEGPMSKKDLLNKLSAGQIKLVVGTHSLIQEKINFKELALVIIDEQHRFGVRQRQELKHKNANSLVPHLLSMTAPPIPRSLALTLYGDLDISLIKEKPLGRQPIKTYLVPEKKRLDAYNFIRGKIKEGQQIFVICPLIDESDKLGLKSVTKEYKKLNEEIFPDLEIKFLHGKLKTEEKSRIMEDFKNNKFPILVATSVIEVGVDIPGATIMLIESAERFGLSQLHQFRGRIGRNDLASFCLLFSSDDSQLTLKRLKALATSNDGFQLAELDLALRGSGEIFGTKQSGLMNLKIARLSDTELIKKAQYWAKQILAQEKYRLSLDLQNLLTSLKTEMHLE